MTRKIVSLLSLALIAGIGAASLLAAPPPAKPKKQPAEPKSDGWRETFAVDKKNLVSTGVNPYFDLTPGMKHFYEHKKSKLTITVLAETKIVDGVETRVVEEREESDGMLKEV